ncbi:MAG: hypothetical protein M0P49_05095 [Bacilli bacterium]|nr:hypothetical protein [Bacilli bacterium]
MNIERLGEIIIELSGNNENRACAYDLCYNAFCFVYEKRSKAFDDNDIDLLALNLGMYLANWGMYRNSKLLTKYNYRVHVGVIRILLAKKYKEIYRISPNDYDDRKISLVIEIFNELKTYYCKKGINATDTLITKILFGTLGCTIAVDTNVRNSLREIPIQMAFGRRQLKQIREFYLNNQNSINKIVNKIERPAYHTMRCIDLLLFLNGENLIQN